MSKTATAAKSANLIPGATGDWEVVIGLEVHAQVASQSKLFSGSSTAFGAEPNSHVSLVDAAMPGMLPVINEECVAQAVRTGLGLKAQINLRSVFDRKNYFYPDLPQGYQISQYKQPIVGEGEVEIDVDGETMRVGIERLHLEQDAGKSIHDQHPEYSYVDLNRSGVALMEIVSKPDMRSAKQAQAYVTEAAHHPALPRHLRRRHGEGQPARRRQRVGAQARRSARHALRDQERQLHPLHRPGDRGRGAPPDRHHRGRRQDRSGNAPVRSRRRARRARCAPRKRRTTTAISPIPTCCRSNSSRPRSRISKQHLPELPDEKRARFVKDYGLSAYDASVLVAERESADYFEAVLGLVKDAKRDGKLAANWVINELFGRLNKEGQDIADSKVSAGADRGHRRPDRVQRHLRQDRQGPVRDRLDARAATRPRSSRSAA